MMMKVCVHFCFPFCNNQAHCFLVRNNIDGDATTTMTPTLSYDEDDIMVEHMGDPLGAGEELLLLLQELDCASERTVDPWWNDWRVIMLSWMCAIYHFRSLNIAHSAHE